MFKSYWTPKDNYIANEGKKIEFDGQKTETSEWRSWAE